MQFPQIHKSKKTIDIILNNLKKDTSFKGIYDTFDYVSKFQLLLTNRYNDIMNGLPDYKDMNDYYLLMSKNIISEKDIEKYKNHYKKTIQIINQLSERYKRKLKKERKKEVIKQLKQEYFGRVFSACKGIINKYFFIDWVKMIIKNVMNDPIFKISSKDLSWFRVCY
jgi:GTP1/Obg family GTP-binding protein